MTATAEEADRFIPLLPGADFEAIWTLRALVQGRTLDAAVVREQTGVELSTWETLASQLRGARFGVLIHDEHLALAPGGPMNLEALEGLARDLSAHTRAVVNALRGSGNRSGADNVVLWQTGYPFGVNFARGYPRYNPGEFTAVAGLERHEFDAVLLLGVEKIEHFSDLALARLHKLPSVCISSSSSDLFRHAIVGVTLAKLGLSSPGTVYRMDEVPLPLRNVSPSSLPGDVQLLEMLSAKLDALANQPTTPKFA